MRIISFNVSPFSLVPTGASTENVSCISGPVNPGRPNVRSPDTAEVNANDAGLRETEIAKNAANRLN